MAVSEHHIRESITRYVSDQTRLLDFETWFIPRAWEILETSSPAATLVSHVELLLAEFTNGDLTEDELREALRPYSSVATLDESSVEVSWEVATSAQAPFLQLNDLPHTEHVWFRVTQTKEPQAA